MINPEEAQPLSTLRPNKLENAEPVYFFEINDGKVIATKGEEAWSLYSRKQQNLSNKVTFKLIGTGTGEVFQDAVLKAHAIPSTIENLPQIKEILQKGFDDELNACRGKIIPPKPGKLDKIWV